MANETTEELVSALVDGELSDDAVRSALDHLREESSLGERWTRYHLIRDVLQNNLAESVAPELHARVWRAIEKEPPLLAPRRTRLRLTPVLRQAAGFAVAASVTAVAILGFQSLNQSGEEMTVAERGSGAETANVAASTVSGKEIPLDAYILNHNEYSASTGMQGALPYVRIVSHETAGK